MPSTESEALKDQFRTISGRMAANPDMDISTLRDMVDGLQARASEPIGVTYEEVLAGGRAALWCNPLEGAQDRVILYTHGGGYISNTMDTARKLAGHLAKATGCRALVPDYRLAPEHPFPAQLEDATAVYHWLLDQGTEPGHIATAGESAGGNLATTTVLKLREDGAPLPAAGTGFSPWYDLEAIGETFDTNADTDAFLSRQVNGFWQACSSERMVRRRSRWRIRGTRTSPASRRCT